MDRDTFKSRGALGKSETDLGAYEISRPPPDVLACCQGNCLARANTAIGGSRSQRGSRLARSKFAADSPLEGDGFELPVPREKKSRTLTGGSKQPTRLEQARTASVYLLKQDVVKASSLR